MAYPRKNGEPVYRSSDLDEVQGYDDLRMIWKHVRMSAKGKTAPLTDRVRQKIAKGLKRTMSGGKSGRTRAVAAAMTLAMADGDWDRDVYRKPTKGLSRMARASRPKGASPSGSEDGDGRGDAEGEAQRRDGGQVDG